MYFVFTITTNKKINCYDKPLLLCGCLNKMEKHKAQNSTQQFFHFLIIAGFSIQSLNWGLKIYKTPTFRLSLAWFYPWCVWKVLMSFNPQILTAEHLRAHTQSTYCFYTCLVHKCRIQVLNKIVFYWVETVGDELQKF